MKNKVFYLIKIGRWVGGITLLLMVLFISADVFARYVLNSAIIGAREISEFMMVIIVFLGLSYTASTRGHISVEVVISRLSSPTQDILRCITTLLSVLLSAFLAWRLGMNAYSTFEAMEATTILKIPIAPFIFISALGFGMLTLELMVQFYDSLSHLTKNK